MKRSVLWCLAAAASVIASLGAPGEARGEIIVGVDIDAAFVPVNWVVDPGGVGLVFDARLGYGLDLWLLRLIPEWTAGYGSFPEDDKGNPKQAMFFTNGGLRVTAPVLPIVTPGVYAHLGYGELEGSASDFVVSVIGMSFDAALVLDFEILPMFTLGLQFGYAGIYDTGREEAASWLHAGGHFELAL